MIVQQNIPTLYRVVIGTELMSYDFEDRKWMAAKVIDISEMGKVHIECEDGIEWWEDGEELSNRKAYRFYGKDKSQ